MQLHLFKHKKFIEWTVVQMMQCRNQLYSLFPCQHFKTTLGIILFCPWIKSGVGVIAFLSHFSHQSILISVVWEILCSVRSTLILVVHFETTPLSQLVNFSGEERHILWTHLFILSSLLSTYFSNPSRIGLSERKC